MLRARVVALVAILEFLAPPLSQSAEMTDMGQLGGNAPRTAEGADAATRARVQTAYDGLSLGFELNKNQAESPVRFVARGHGYNLFIAPTQSVLVLRKPQPAGRLMASQPSLPAGRLKDGRAGTTGTTVLRMELVGASSEPEIMGLEELPGRLNYFIGKDPARWRHGVRTYAKVQFRAVYPGVDLVFYGNQRQLEYDFVVGPGADPGVIALHFQGVQDIRMDVQGDLILTTDGEPIRLHRPRIYQEANGIRHEISGGYVLKSPQRVGFHIGPYDAARPLIIDPVLVYGTYLGGTGDDVGLGIAVDGAGHAYVTGVTTSLDFPVHASLQGIPPSGSNAFVTKLDSTGAAMVYSTYLGGTGDDGGNSIAVDGGGHAYVTGFTASPDFPTASPVQASYGGNRDAFVAKLGPTGAALAYATYLGGSEEDWGLGIAVDAAGHAYVTGFTASADFPTRTPLQGNLRGASDAFVTKLGSAGSGLIYSTYLGGSGDDGSNGIAVDATGHAYVTGYSSSSDFPVADPVQTSPGGKWDAFVAKVAADTSRLIYASYLGGSGEDSGFGIAVDADGHAYITGWTDSPDFPTAAPLQLALGGSDAFIAKIAGQEAADTGLVLTAGDVSRAPQQLFESAQDNWRNQRWSEALAIYRHVTNSPASPYVSKAHIQIGRYHKYHRKWAEAIAEYQQAISKARVTRDVEDAQTSMAAALLTKGEYGSAISICREVLAKTTD